MPHLSFSWLSCWYPIYICTKLSSVFCFCLKHQTKCFSLGIVWPVTFCFDVVLNTSLHICTAVLVVLLFDFFEQLHTASVSNLQEVLTMISCSTCNKRILHRWVQQQPTVDLYQDDPLAVLALQRVNTFLCVLYSRVFTFCKVTLVGRQRRPADTSALAPRSPRPLPLARRGQGSSGGSWRA